MVGKSSRRYIGIGTQKIDVLETKQQVVVIGNIIHPFSIPAWNHLNGRNTYGILGYPD